MNKLKNFHGLTGSTLKLIAIITMFIDHFGAIVMGRGILTLASVRGNSALYKDLYVCYRILRYIGRIAFPIFCFLLVEGFLHTRNQKKYALRLAVFTLISEIPFDLGIYNDWFYLDKQNVFFTLLIGMLVMMVMSRCKNEWLQFSVMGLGIFAGYLLKTDYGARGVFLICLLYLLRYNRPLQCLGGSLTMLDELTGPLAFVPVWLYNGERGRTWKYVFYWFYPVHLLLLSGVRFLILTYFH